MKRYFSIFLAILLSLSLAACGDTTAKNTDKQPEVSEKKEQTTEEKKEDTSKDKKTIVQSLNGPTSMGLAKLITEQRAMDKSDYDFEIVKMATDVVQGLIKGDVDIAAIPANLASTVYNKSAGKVQVAAINTLSVVYIVDNDGTINSVEDLRGKTIYATGQGQTPEYILNEVLSKNGLEIGKDVNVEYKAEATEVASILASEENVVAMLPQPFITVTQTKNDKVKVAIDLNDEWKALHNGDIVTGVLVVNKEYAEKNKESFNKFLDDYKASVEYVKANPDQASKMIEDLDIVKAPIAKKALPDMNIVYIDGQELKANLSEYLGILNEANPASIGGAMPAEDFYYNR